MIHSNFVAELHCKYGRVGVANTAFGDHPVNGAIQDGWLCTERGRSANSGFDPVPFHFEYIEEAGGRTHYNIYGAEGWAFKDAKLSQDFKGFLGLYGIYVVGRLTELLNPANMLDGILNKNFWKIEALQEWDGSVEGAEGVDFYLRDSRGYRTSQFRGDSGVFLNAGTYEGEILTFNFRNIRLV